MIDAHCESCCFFSPAPHGDRGTGLFGQCRKRSPQLMLLPSGQTVSRWPLVNDKAWCGDHATASIAA